MDEEVAGRILKDWRLDAEKFAGANGIGTGLAEFLLVRRSFDLIQAQEYYDSILNTRRVILRPWFYFLLGN